MTFELKGGLCLEDAARIVHQPLADAGVDNPELDARLLLAHALDESADILLRSPQRLLQDSEKADYQSLIARRISREPVSQILGKRGFWNSDFIVNRHVLDPRPDSETLIETVLQAMPDRARVKKILDLGTGSGCLVLSLLQEYPTATGIAVDASEAALAVAVQNADNLGLSGRCECRIGNWFEGLSEQFDVIVSNPPYIETKALAHLQTEVREYEPVSALDGGTDGLICYRTILNSAKNYLVDGGLLAFEVGIGQAADVSLEMEKRDFRRINIFRDLAGRERVVTGFRKN